MSSVESSTSTPRPRRRRRLLRTAKLGGLTVSTLIVAMFLMSRWWEVSVSHYRGSETDHFVRGFSIQGGTVWYLRFLNVDGDPTPGLGARICPRVPDAWTWQARWSLGPGLQIVWIPLYIPFLLTAIPTAALFLVDRASVRRRLAGQCVACGYDLHGLAPRSVYPECGTVRT